MSGIRGFVTFAVVMCAFVLVGAWLSVESFAQADKGVGLVGAWTLNKDLSDAPQAPGAGEGPGRGDPGSTGDPGRRGGGGGGRRGGGFGGGGRGGGFGGGAPVARNPDEVARMRDAMRDITNPPDHLVIVATDTLIVLTGPDGRTTRLSPDGKKIKDDNTNIGRQTKWDGTKLVSEITGLPAGRVTETYVVDNDHHQLHVTAQFEGSQGRTISHVYDLDPR